MILDSIAKIKPSVWGATALALVVSYVLFKRTTTVPGPRAYPLIGNMLDISPYAKKKQVHKLFRLLFEKYGDIYCLNIGGKLIIYISDPTTIKRILTDTDSFARDDIAQQAMMDMMPNGLFALPSGDTWKRHRKSLQPAFSPPHIKFTAQTAFDICDDVIDYLNLKVGQKIDIHFLLSVVSLDIIGLVGFGHDFKSIQALIKGQESDAIKQVEILAEVVANRLFTPPPLWSWLGFGIGTKKVVDVISYFSEIVTNVAEQRKAAAANNAEKKDFDKDVVERLVLSKNESGQPLFTPKEMLDELVGFFIAGQETTGNTMSFLFYALAQHPEVVSKIRKEYESFDHDGPIYDLLPKLKYLECVIKESQRIYSVAGRTGRISIKPVEVLGHKLPANTLFFTGFDTMHIHPKYWKNPDEFIPERFEEPIAAHSFMPFGDGPMNCIGQKMALIETKIVLLRILEKFDFELAPGEPYEPLTTFTYGFKKGLILKVSKRQ